jgi:hypothetical protein
LGGVHTLDFYNCRAITDVSALGSVHTLTLRACRGITDVSAVGSVCTLTLFSCDGITDVSDLGSVLTLTLRYCPGIADVSALGGVHTLTLSHCPGITDTSIFDRDGVMRGTTVVLEGAGVPEVDGEYAFVSIKHGGGYYGREGTYQGQPARFTLYKCNLKNGDYQWFLCITPGNEDPGSFGDVDFYYEPAKLADKLPPLMWY